MNRNAANPPALFHHQNRAVKLGKLDGGPAAGRTGSDHQHVIIIHRSGPNSRDSRNMLPEGSLPFDGMGLMLFPHSAERALALFACSNRAKALGMPTSAVITGMTQNCDR